jgi:CBS domain-containing protein
MTEAVVVIERDRPVSEVLACFSQYRIHHLPVVEQGRLAGMLSTVDLVKLQHLVPKSVVDRSAFLDERMSIETLMQNPVVSLTPATSIGEAAERMMDAGVHAAPVLDEAELVVGIVTTSDVIRSLLRGPPRRGAATLPKTDVAPPPAGDPEQVHYHQKPTTEEHATALSTARLLHVEARDPRFLGKTMLYLEQRNAFLDKVFELADRFLLSGQDVHVHALLLKAIHAAKRAEEHATGRAKVPFPLE